MISRHPSKTGRIALAALAAAFAPVCAASAASIDVGGGTRIEKPLRSLVDLRDHQVIKQRFDYSCGSAALATLLHFGFGDEISERDVLVEVFETLSPDDADLRRKDGLSLLDLQRVARARGYRAEGFRLLPEHLPRLRGPVIVYIEPFGYEHFAVLRGVRGDRIFLADPSRGNLRQPAYRFIDDWVGEDGKGVIFVVEPQDGIPTQRSPLAAPVDGVPQPELMSVNDLLLISGAPARLPTREGLSQPGF